MLSPIVLFAYNRPLHLQHSLQSLLKNPLAKQSELYIYSDAPKNDEQTLAVMQVRNLLKELKGFGKIHLIERPYNYGLARSIIEGVSEVIGQYGKVIVLEDDLIFAENFLAYMNDALEQYAHTPSIFSVTGWNLPIHIPNYQADVYLSPRPASWSWGTWLDRWQQADWEVNDFQTFIKDRQAVAQFNQGGEDLTPMLLKQQKGLINSWAIRWAYTHYRKNVYCLYPVVPKTHNIGTDGSGVHVSALVGTKYDVKLQNKEYTLPMELSLDAEVMTAFRGFFKQSWYRKFINQLWLYR